MPHFATLGSPWVSFRSDQIYYMYLMKQEKVLNLSLIQLYLKFKRIKETNNNYIELNICN